MFEKTLFGRLFQNLGRTTGPRDQLLRESYRITAELEHEKNKNTQDLIWINIISIFLIHFFAVYCLFAYPMSSRLIKWGLALGLIGGVGVTGGAHRLWAHRSYKAKLPFRILLLSCYTIAGQNSVYDWVRDHRVHHKYSETDADPHNVKRGFFFAHVGWLMMRKHPDVIEKGKAIDMSDIVNDPLLAFHTKHFILFKILLCFVIPTIVPPLFWGESWMMSITSVCVVRYVLSLNCTWLVNSAAHMWGNRPYDKNIKPSENLWVSLASMGEGWHNYHHVFPWDYKAAEMGPYLLNITTFVIDVAAKLGQAYDLKHPSDELILQTAKNRGDGTFLRISKDKHD